jgi:hypothetical protein
VLIAMATAAGTANLKRERMAIRSDGEWLEAATHSLLNRF